MNLRFIKSPEDCLICITNIRSPTQNQVIFIMFAQIQVHKRSKLWKKYKA